MERALREAPGRTGFREDADKSPCESVLFSAATGIYCKYQVRMVLTADLSLTNDLRSRRPTGWHGESGGAQSGGHITVDFRSYRNKHITTHHIYPTDDGYLKMKR
jgi:hypothetical protein